MALHLTEIDNQPWGVGFVIGPTQVLTAAHVIRDGPGWRRDLWVSFPKSAVSPDVRRRVIRCLPERPDPSADVALLELDQPVPPLVTPARLRCPAPHVLHGRPWFAFGFPAHAAHVGDVAAGSIGAHLAHGTIKLHAEYEQILPGFSGSALWSHEYDAVVGIVINAWNSGGDGHALTLHQVDQHQPGWHIRRTGLWSPEAAGEEAHAAWGWSLTVDPERGRHWSPRARGVSADSDPGYRFRGRTAALTRVTQWLGRGPVDARVLVVTGSPGVGKSAVLGRVITTADAEMRAALPEDDDAVRASVGTVSCAVHVKGKTVLEVAVEIAKAASIALPAAAEDLVPSLRDRLVERRGRFNLVIDALDEAASPADARAILNTLVLTIAQTCSDVGAQVVVGSRRSDDHGSLLDTLEAAAQVIDLDRVEYFEESDLVEYAYATLRSERAGNPYLDDHVANAVARRIAIMAERNFLVAGLVARTHGLYDQVAVDPARMVFTTTVDAALDGFITRLPRAGRASARLALTVLAYAEAQGLPLALWQSGIAALGEETTVEDLAAFAQTSAANFIVQTGTDPATRCYRLYHQALNEGLLRRRPDRGADEGRLMDAWLRDGRDADWDDTVDYLRRWLPAHAARCGRVDDLLADDDYLLRADLGRLVAAADTAKTASGRARARLLRRTPQAVDRGPDERAAMFSVTEILDRLDSHVSVPATAPYAACWANTPPGLELIVLEGHTDSVLGICAVPIGGRNLIASAGEDGTVLLWDPVTGQTEHVCLGHTDRVRDVCAIPLPGQTLLGSASDDGTIGIWDPLTGNCLRMLTGHADWVRGICATTVDGATLLASVSDDRTVRLWDPLTGDVLKVLSGRISWATAACFLTLDGHTLLASASYDGAVTIWDPTTAAEVRGLDGHTAWVTGLTPVEVDGAMMLASAGYDGTVRLWDPRSGRAVQCWRDSDRVISDLCVVRVGERDLLASTTEQGLVRLRDPANGVVHRELSGHSGWVTDVCTVTVGGRDLLASTSEDGTVRLWDPATGEASGVIDGGRIGPIVGLTEAADQVASTTDGGAVRLWNPANGQPGRTVKVHNGEVTAVCETIVDGQSHVASTGQDGKVVLWNAATGSIRNRLAGHIDRAGGVCAMRVADGDVLASVGDDQAVRLWNLTTGAERTLDGHTEWVHAVCTVPGEAGDLLASASHDGTARVWDPSSGTCLRILSGHHGAVNAVCAVPLERAHLLATAGADGRIRLWEPDTGRPVGSFEGHRTEVTSVCVARRGRATVLVSAGLDRTVRLWDPVTGAHVETIPVHHRALSCRFVADRLIIGTEKGILALELRGSFE